MHVYTFDVYSYTITYLLTNIIVIVYNRNVYNMLLVICNSECVLTSVGNKEMSEKKMNENVFTADSRLLRNER